MDQGLAAQLAEAVTQRDASGARQQLANLDWVSHGTDDEICELLESLLAGVGSSGVADEHLLVNVLRELVRRSYSGGARQWKKLSDRSRRAVVALYGALGKQRPARYLLAQLLAVSRAPEDLATFAELIVRDSVADATAVSIAFGPLFQHKDYDPTFLFPRLLDAMTQPAVAPAVVDLANFVTREKLVDLHPAADRRVALMALLGGLVSRLGQVEERPESVSQDAKQLSAMVAGSVSLAVSLCDALALIADPAAIGKLYQALELRHRRLRTEAAAALARLGEPTGREVLLSMAAEPVTRLRVLAYAAELGIEDQLDERFTTAAARAESELVLWLSQPAQLGFPPSDMELVDSQTLYWPGYDEPIECFLFRFTYQLEHGEYSNIGMAGPGCQAFEADLADLPPDDIYAVFAGWQVEHEDIYDLDVNVLSEPQRLEMVRLERRLHDDGYEQIQPLTLGMFFGERALVTRARREGQAGIVVASHDEIQWHITEGRLRPLGPQEALYLYRGRKLLRTFNP